MDLENMDKTTMLKMVREGWRELEETVARFDDAQMLRANPPDGWSVLDLMFHISHWEDFPLQRLKEANRGDKPDLSLNLTEEELDQVNQDLLEQGRKRTLDDVKVDFQRVHQELYAELVKIPADRDDPWWSLWPSPVMAWKVIIGDTSDHYADHLVDLKKWLG